MLFKWQEIFSPYPSVLALLRLFTLISQVKLLFTRISVPWDLRPENKIECLSRHPLPELCMPGVWEVFVGPVTGFLHFCIGGYYMDLHDPWTLVFKNGYAHGSRYPSWYLRRWRILLHLSGLSWIGHMTWVHLGWQWGFKTHLRLIYWLLPGTVPFVQLTQDLIFPKTSTFLPNGQVSVKPNASDYWPQNILRYYSLYILCCGHRVPRHTCLRYS